jgi:hypothetical protein
MAFLSFVVTGCGKNENVSPATPPSSAPASYMKDERFRQDLAERRRERTELARVRNRLTAQMKAMVDKVKAELKTEDPAAVKAVLEKDPQWRSLYQRCADLNTAIAEKRRDAREAVRARISPVTKPAAPAKISK